MGANLPVLTAHFARLRWYYGSYHPAGNIKIQIEEKCNFNV